MGDAAPVRRVTLGSMQTRDMVEPVRSWLGWPADATERLSALAAAGPPTRPFELPEGEELVAILERLDVPVHAISEIQSGTPSPRTHPEAWWLLEQLHKQLTKFDGTETSPPWPAPEPSDDPLTRYFHLYVFLGAIPDVLRLNDERGISEEVTWATLRDVGLQVAHYQSRHGRAGFDGAFWIWQHFRGAIYLLGRLQFNLLSIEFDPEDPGTVGFRRGDRALGVHIPAHGPLTPQACDDAFARARSFFSLHFGDPPYRVATCGSWLLDDQLADYLSPDTNIIRFQQRFTPVRNWSQPGDEDVMRFVFGYVPDSIDDLPQRTTLEKAVVSHLRDGHHWHVRLGWLEL